MLQTSLSLILLAAAWPPLVDAAQSTAGAKKSFVRLTTESLEVITDAGEPLARQALARLERMDRLLGPRQTPLRAYLFRDESLYAQLRPVPTSRGFYQSSAERDYLAVLLGPDSLRALAHEFVHASLEHATARRPLWLEEGVAEFYSTVSLEKGKWLLGRPIENHVRLLQQADWMRPAALLAANKDSSLYDEANRAGLFYAQSWAVVHLLYTQPGYREKLPAFAELLDAGVPAAEALPRAFGRSPLEILRDAEQRVKRGAFPVAELAGDDVAPASEPRLDTVGPELVAELALACGKPALAARLYERAANPTALGLLALAQGDNQAALAHFDQAIAANSPEATAYFEAAMLRRDQKKPFEPLLRQTVERNPRHPEAWFLLGLEAAKREQWEDAVEAYQRATAILPRQANFWHALALAFHRSGRADEAARAAIKCRLAAASGPEREMAAALNRLVNTAAAPPPRQPAVIIPDAWNGLQGDAISDGVLEELICANPAVLRITGVGELKILRPKEIRITGGTAELTCGLQKRPVRVGYIQSSRELVSVEFVP